jgi:hypothetical protein
VSEASPAAEAFVDRTPGLPDVRGMLHRAADASGDALVLTHGAGSNANNPLLVAVATAFAERGVTVLRCDLPFRQARPTGPPSPRGAATDRLGLRRAILTARALVRGRVFVGGQSYGGRQATMVVASEPALVAGVLALAYPLHPPARPAELRTAHFGNLDVPALFVHGTSDPFGSIEELRTALSLIPAPTRLLSVDGVGHDLGRGRRQTASGASLTATIVGDFLALVDAPRQGARRVS